MDKEVLRSVMKHFAGGMVGILATFGGTEFFQMFGFSWRQGLLFSTVGVLAFCSYLFTTAQEEEATQIEAFIEKEVERRTQEKKAG